MLDEYDKCNFCQSYNSYEGCAGWYCHNKDNFTPDRAKIIEKAQESGMNVADVVALMNLEG